MANYSNAVTEALKMMPPGYQITEDPSRCSYHLRYHDYAFHIDESLLHKFGNDVTKIMDLFNDIKSQIDKQILQDYNEHKLIRAKTMSTGELKQFRPTQDVRMPLSTPEQVAEAASQPNKESIDFDF